MSNEKTQQTGRRIAEGEIVRKGGVGEKPPATKPPKNMDSGVTKPSKKSD